jgi:hypothetical protein
MAGNFRASAGIEPAQSRTAVQGSYVPVRQAPVQVQAPAPQAAYGLAYQMGGPNYMYGVTPRFGAYYRDGGMPPGQIHGNMPGSREGADMFGFWPTMFQSSPYATASQMYTPGLGVMPLIGYPSRYPHVVMGGYTDYGAPIANQAMGMMLPLLMMGLYRQMFPMPSMPGAAGGAGGRGGTGGSGGGGGKSGAPGDGPAPAAGPLKSSGVPDGVPAMDYSAVDGMPIRPSSDSTYHVYDAGWKPGSAPASTGDSWVDRAISYGKRFPPTMPLAFGLDYARRYPNARRAVEGAVPVIGPVIRGVDEYLSR